MKSYIQKFCLSLRTFPLIITKPLNTLTLSLSHTLIFSLALFMSHSFLSRFLALSFSHTLIFSPALPLSHTHSLYHSLSRVNYIYILFYIYIICE